MAYTIQDFLEIKSASPSGFSPDSSKVLISSNFTGTAQLYRVPREGGPLIQITDFEEPVAGVYLPTSDEILLQMDEGGNERAQIYLLSDDGANLRKVVYEPDYLNFVGGVSRDGSAIVYSSNRRNGVDFDIYVRHLKTSEEKLVFDLGGMCSSGGFSPDGRMIAVSKPSDERSMDNDIFLVDVVTGDRLHVTPHDDESYFGRPAWLPDGSGFFFPTDQGREFQAIARYGMASASWHYVIERDWDLSSVIDLSGTRLLVSANEEGSSRVELYDPTTLAPLGEVSLPGRGVGLSEFSSDGRFIGYFFSSSIEPGDAWLFDTAAGITTRLTDSPKPVPREVFVEPELHRFTSFDGEKVPLFIYLPRDRSEKRPPPVIVYIHGGPESQFVPSFNPVIQYFVHRGFAVAAPNVRGSTGYGKRYHHLDDVRKRLDSVKDLEALHSWMTSSGLVDPKRAALMGGSYGGYMVLAGLAFQPGLWAAGVDIVGVSSLVTFLENTSAWRRKVREREYGSVEKDREFLEAASPITHIDRMRAPLFIIHGANDPRVPLSEAQQIFEALNAKQVPCELLVYEDEGHGLGKLRNRLDAYPKAADFLDRILRG